MKKMFIIVVLLVAWIGFSSPAFADSIHLTEYDAAPAFFINAYATSSVSIVVTGAAAGTVTVTLDGCANTIDGNSASYDTVAELCAAINACTNAAGEVGIQCLTEPSADADTTKAKLLSGSYYADPGSKTNSLKWDTSACLFYEQYLDSAYQPIVIDQIFGSVTGTGDATFDVYVDRVKKWTTVVALPTTVSSTNDANLVTLSSVIPMPIDCNIPVRAKSTAFIRATRTTATTGNLGCAVKPQ